MSIDNWFLLADQNAYALRLNAILQRTVCTIVIEILEEYVSVVQSIIQNTIVDTHI